MKIVLKTEEVEKNFKTLKILSTSSYSFLAIVNERFRPLLSFFTLFQTVFPALHHHSDCEEVEENFEMEDEEVERIALYVGVKK